MRPLLFCMLAIFGVCHAKNLSDVKNCIKVISHYERTYAIPKDLLQSIALVETGTQYRSSYNRVPWPWTVNRNGTSHYFENKSSAKKFLRRCIRRGETNLDVGCMQINLKHHPKAFPSLSSALDPRCNVKYAAVLLSQHYKKTHSWQEAVKRYHSSNKALGKKYYSKVQVARKEVSYAKSLVACRGGPCFQKRLEQKPSYGILSKAFSLSCFRREKPPGAGRDPSHERQARKLPPKPFGILSRIFPLRCFNGRLNSAQRSSSLAVK